MFVLDKHHRPLQPCHPATARRLLKSGRAVVHRRVPFVIRVKDRTVEESNVDGVHVGIDPGSRHTGLAVFRQTDVGDRTTGVVESAREGLWLGEVEHRGHQISINLTKRSALRRGRRTRNLRYRAPRFANRHPATCDACGRNAQRGRRLCWPCQDLARAERGRGQRPIRSAPSLWHRVDTTMSWVGRVRQWAPMVGVHVESVRFDTQAMQNPEISGVEYQRGTLFGFEVHEYLLAKWRHTCAYCDASGAGPGGVVLTHDHILPRAKGGSDRVSNLALACIPCNEAKGSEWVQDFLADDPPRLARVLAQAKRPLRDAAAVNSTRNALYRALVDTGLPVEAATGGRTKYNRTRLSVPKTHALDALCVGDVDTITGWPNSTLLIGCTGRGGYARTRSDKYGFPRLLLTRTKRHHGFATGDLVRAVVPTGKYAGVHAGRVAVRARGTFRVNGDDINHAHVRLIQRADGYTYTRKLSSAV